MECLFLIFTHIYHTVERYNVDINVTIPITVTVTAASSICMTRLYYFILKNSPYCIITIIKFRTTYNTSSQLPLPPLPTYRATFVIFNHIISGNRFIPATRPSVLTSRDASTTSCPDPAPWSSALAPFGTIVAS